MIKINWWERNRAWMLGLVVMLVLLAGLLALRGRHYLFFSVACLACSLAPAYWHFEHRHMQTRLLVFLAIMIALGVLGRVPFAAIPNVQLTSFVVIVSAIALGPELGFVSGSMMALVSNLFLGQGPWTPWQMLAWGLMGVTTGLLGRTSLRNKVGVIVVWGALWGFWFGWIMDLWYALAYVRPVRAASLLVSFASSAVFDSFHAMTNAVSLLVLYRPWQTMMKRLMTKYRLI